MGRGVFVRRLVNCQRRLHAAKLAIMRALLLAFSLLLVPAAVSAQEGPAAPPPSPELIARAEAGDGEAMEWLAHGYLEAGDQAQGLRWARAAAEAGRPEGMNLYAALLRGQTPARDAEADHWELRAIEAGSSAAALNRGQRIILTDGGDRAWSEGMALIRRFEHADSGAVLLGVADRYGAVRHATPARFRELMQFAAERGSAEAQWQYAMMLRQGYGGPADLGGAYAWARRSGEAGYLEGVISTAVMLATGEGVAEDDVEARAWYQRAVDRGSAHALRSLGMMFIVGEGGAVDRPRGWAYLTIASGAGDEYAPQLAQRFRAVISPDDQRAADVILNEWMSAHPAPH